MDALPVSEFTPTSTLLCCEYTKICAKSYLTPECYLCPQMWEIKIRSCQSGQTYTLLMATVPLSGEVSKDANSTLLKAFAI